MPSQSDLILHHKLVKGRFGLFSIVYSKEEFNGKRKPCIRKISYKQDPWSRILSYGFLNTNVAVPFEAWFFRHSYDKYVSNFDSCEKNIWNNTYWIPKVYSEWLWTYLSPLKSCQTERKELNYVAQRSKPCTYRKGWNFLAHGVANLTAPLKILDKIINN